jgi:hypothetical protein
MTNEEIEAKGYNPIEIRRLVNNKQEMERLDRIIPKSMKHEQFYEDKSYIERDVHKVDND